MRPKNIWEFLKSYGYELEDIARHLGLSLTTVEAYAENLWTIPPDVMRALQELRVHLLTQRYG